MKLDGLKGLHEATHEELIARLIELYISLIEDATPIEALGLFQRLKKNMLYQHPGPAAESPDVRVYMWCKEKIFEGMRMKDEDGRWAELERLEEWLAEIYPNIVKQLGADNER